LNLANLFSLGFGGLNALVEITHAAGTTGGGSRLTVLGLEQSLL